MLAEKVKFSWTAQLFVSCGRKRSPLLHDFDEDHVTTPFMLITDHLNIPRKSNAVNPLQAFFSNKFTPHHLPPTIHLYPYSRTQPLHSGGCPIDGYSQAPPKTPSNPDPSFKSQDPSFKILGPRTLVHDAQNLTLDPWPWVQARLQVRF